MLLLKEQKKCKNIIMTKITIYYYSFSFYSYIFIHKNLKILNDINENEHIIKKEKRTQNINRYKLVRTYNKIMTTKNETNKQEKLMKLIAYPKKKKLKKLKKKKHTGKLINRYYLYNFILC